MSTPSLLLVYNADSGLFASLTDFAHKLIAPQTYACNLCALTYGNFAMHKRWREYLASLTLPVHFLHRDELQRDYPTLAHTALPVVFLSDGREHRVILSSEVINTARNLDDLMNLLRGALNM